ncbi:hypothetical protein [Hymenobacter terricola]|nr:hypothetical protein [Hymenobacter terricola]
MTATPAVAITRGDNGHGLSLGPGQVRQQLREHLNGAPDIGRLLPYKAK